MSKPAKAQRRDEARAEALRLRAEAERAARRQRTIAVVLLVVGLAVIGGVVAWILSNQPDPPPDFSGVEQPLAEVTLPGTATEQGGFVVGPDGVVGETEGAAEDATELVVYADYMCPLCGLFEQTNAADVAALRQAGDVVVEYRPVSILDRFAQGTEFSTRSATAAAFVADRAPEAFLAFNDGMFASQPAENSPGLSDAEIAEIARAAGVPDDAAAVIEDGSYLEGEDSFRPFVAAATEQATRDFAPQFGTPTVLMDGENIADMGIDWRVPGALASAIAESRG